MNASEVGSDDWWRVVQSMPLQEAYMYLSDYKVQLLKSAGTPEYARAAAEVARVNAEIHRVSQAQNAATWINAMRAVLPEHLIEAVRQEKVRLETSIQYRGKP